MQKQIIMSLGYNCEISFRIEDYLGYLDSYLFSWSYELDRDLFIEALRNIDDIFTGNLELQPDHMICCTKYKIKFHPRYDILPKVGKVTEEAYLSATNELRKRIHYLKKKTQECIQNEDCEIIFIVKVEDKGEEENYRFLKKLCETIDSIRTEKFLLVSVLEKKALVNKISLLESEKFKIRTVKSFAPLKHTDIMGDIRGWNRILSEFVKKNDNLFYKRWFIRCYKIIPAVIVNKINKFARKLRNR